MTTVGDTFELGSLVRIGPETFTDLSGALVDPTTVSLSVKKPDGTIDGPFTFAGAQVVKESVGIYHFDYTPATRGHYLYRWISTGAGQAAGVGSFDIEDSFATTEPPVSGVRQRILAGTAATLRTVLADQDGNPADASGALTVAVSRADGTVVLAAGTATVHGTTGNYSVALTSAQTATLDQLTAVWTDAATGRTVTTRHDIVGGFFFSLTEARASNDGQLADTVKYSDAQVLIAREEVEVEAEEICDVAFVPRYARVLLDGNSTGEITLPHNRIRRVRSVKILTSTGGAVATTLTAGQLAALSVDHLGVMRRTDGGWFDEGRANVVVEYEHGWDQPPTDLRKAALVRLRWRLNSSKTGVNDRATSFTAENGQTYQLDTAGAFKTGMPDVDAAYSRYSMRPQDGGGAGAAAVSMQLNFDPQRWSVFHGSVR